MPGLEQTSPCRWVRPASAGRMRHGSREFLPRHVHETGFATVVLSGGYIEAGDTGRHRAGPGDVLLHRPYEFHLDRFERIGAEVLVVPLECERFVSSSGTLADADALVRVAESDPGAAEQALLRQLQPTTLAARDWPDLLAGDLRADPSLSLESWASARGLSAGSISRGFRQLYGVAPASYRLLQRAHRAIRAIRATDTPLTVIAQDCEFADQAHMTRSVRRITALAPQALRARWRRGW